MREFRHSLVKDEVGDYGRIDARAAEKGIQIYGRIGLCNHGHKLVTGLGHLVHLTAGVLVRPLVLLDGNEFRGYFCRSPVKFHPGVRDDTLCVDVGEAGYNRGPEVVMAPKVKALDRLDHV